MAKDCRLALLFCLTLVVVAIYTIINARTWSFDDWTSPHQRDSQEIGHKQPTQVQWQSIPFDDIQLHPSSVECITSKDQDNHPESEYKQVCTFTNIIMYQGELVYIAQDDNEVSKVVFPSPLIFEVGNSPSNDLSLPKIMSASSSKRMNTLIKKQLQHSTANTKKNTPNKNNDHENIRLARFKLGLLQRTRTFSNWFWALNGAGNAFHRLCKYFDECNRESIKKNTVLLQPIIKSSFNLSEVGYVGLPSHHAYAVHDLFSCFGPLLWFNHPSGREVDARPVDQLVIIDKMLVGIGDDVVQPKAALDVNSNVVFNQASPELSFQRVKFLRQCAGLPEMPPIHTKPSILLVNRPYAVGRSILSLDDVYDRLRRALPPDVPVRIFLPRETAGLHEQAAAFNAANIVVAPHGAATANFNFLPRDAVALDVFALKGRFGHDEAVGAAMPNPPYNISVLPVDCSRRTEARTQALSEFADFMTLAGENQAELVLGQDMSMARMKQVRDMLDISLLDWMDYRSYNPDPIELTEKVLDAVKLWEAKVESRTKKNRSHKFLM